MGLPFRRRNHPIIHFEFRLISDTPGDEICGLGIRFQSCAEVGTLYWQSCSGSRFPNHSPSPLVVNWYKVTLPYLSRLLCFHDLNSVLVYCARLWWGRVGFVLQRAFRRYSPPPGSNVSLRFWITGSDSISRNSEAFSKSHPSQASRPIR
jgi:hypothetical protein